MSKSELEEALAFQIRAVRIPQPEREYRFAPPRRWRFDMAWPDQMVAVECEGGVWTRGRHTRGAGFVADCEKYNMAALQGWKVLRFTAEHIHRGDAVTLVARALGVELDDN
jgi:very-short-patch-repair endonuclease